MAAYRQTRRWLLAAGALAAWLSISPLAICAAQAQGASQGVSAVREGRNALAQNRQSDRQSARDTARPRTRIIVRPRRPAFGVRPPTNDVLLYPSPYAANFPGPGFKRFCEDSYEEEHRPSGTVIVPRTRCEWRRAAR